MCTLIFPVRFRKPINKISDKSQDFLRRLASVGFAIGADEDYRTTEIYPIANPRDFPPGPFRNDLVNQVVDVGSVERVLIDVGGPNETEVLQPRFVIALVAAISAVKRDYPEIEVFVSLPSELDDEDDFAPMLDDIFRLGNIIRYYYSSETLISHLCEDADIKRSRGMLSAYLAAASTDPRISLERKMVCHVGNFIIPGIEKRVYDYYEGDFATKEIYGIVCKLISEVLETRETVAVLYDDLVSDWFSRPVQNAVDYLTSEERSVRGVALSESNMDEDGNFDIVLFPICRTGASARTVLENIKYGKSGGTPAVISLVDVGPRELSEDGVRSIKLYGGEVIAEMRVVAWLGNRVEPLASLWSELNIEPNDASKIDLNGNFPADSMWAMVFEAELEEETYVPSYRPSLGKVPNFANMISKNGPLIAAKINRRLGASFGPQIGRNFAFLHPDETTANLLASCVWDLADIDSIPIKSRLIEIAEHSSSLDELQQRASEEGVELDEYTRRRVEELKFITRNALPGSYVPFRVVILAEFIATGGRIRGLQRLASLLGWEVLGTFGIASMYPEVSANAQNFTFYEFGYGSMSQG